MVARMKTTIDLPDELVREVKRLGAERGLTMRELMIEGLRNELGRRLADEPRVDFVFTTVDGDGLQPGVREADLIAMAYEESV